MPPRQPALKVSGMNKAAAIESSKKNAKQVLGEVRDYIRNERDTDIMKWMCLDENIKAQDRIQQNFQERRDRGKKTLPIKIQKFIGTLKRTVRNTIKSKGGTPYSIVRSLFIYWGNGGSVGTLNADQLKQCMSSLGVKLGDCDVQEIVKYYSDIEKSLKNGKSTSRSAFDSKDKNGTTTSRASITSELGMSYDELLRDVTEGEPTVLEYTGQQYFDGADIGERFEDHDDQFTHMPVIVKHFVEAMRAHVMKEMRVHGGTPHHIVRTLFQGSDYDQSGGLDAEELTIMCHKKMKLAMTADNARDIVRFYDRARGPKIFPRAMNYECFLKDVTKGTRPILEFNEESPEARRKAIDSLSKNPLLPKPFAPKPNKVLETLKLLLKRTIAKKVEKLGGDTSSWISEAFMSYDKRMLHKLSNWKDIQGALTRLSISVEEDTSRMLIRAYDVDSDGQMHYLLFIKDMVSEDKHFLAGPRPVSGAPPSAGPGSMKKSPIKKAPLRPKVNNTTSTSRTPSDVKRTLSLLKTHLGMYARKSGGVLRPVDLLYGTCLRFDDSKKGHIPPFAVRNALNAVGLTNDKLSQDNINALVEWFDTNATHTLDYNALSQQLYGNDVMNRKITLPKLNKYAGKADYAEMKTYVSGHAGAASSIGADSLGEELSLADGGHYIGDSGRRDDAPGSIFDSMSGPKDGPSNGGLLGGVATSMLGNYKPDDDKNKRSEVGGTGISGVAAPVIESRHQKESRLASKRNAVLGEKAMIQRKLLEVDLMRKRLNDDFNRRRRGEHEDKVQAEHKVLYAARQAERQDPVARGQKRK